MNLSVDFRYRMLVLLSLGLLGLFLVCLSTFEKATFRCWSTVFRWKYLLKMSGRHIGERDDAEYRQHYRINLYFSDMWIENYLCYSTVQKYIMDNKTVCPVRSIEKYMRWLNKKKKKTQEHGATHFVLKNIRVVSSVEGEWAPSCLHSHSISSVTWLGIT